MNTKKLNLLIVLILFIAIKSQSQQNVGIGTTTPNPKAILDLTSINKGLLLPRLADTASVPLPVPAGLLIYAINVKQMYFYNGSKWTVASGEPSELQRITQSGDQGWRLRGADPSTHGAIGIDAIDLSIGTIPSPWNGATGLFSFAAGHNTRAFGQVSTCFGEETKALGHKSFATGLNTTASGPASFSSGELTEASGEISFSSGYETRAVGDYSLSGGYFTKAKAFGSVALGQYNDTIAGSNPDFWQGGDPLLTLGNGTDNVNRRNAMTVYKNGTMTLQNQTSTPSNSSGRFYILNNEPYFGSDNLSNLWSKTVGNPNNINSINSGNLGIGTSTPLSKVSINGNLSVGSTYAGTNAAPANGLIVEGNMGVGTTNPISKFNVRSPGYGFIHSDATDNVQIGTSVANNAGWLGTKSNHPLHFFTNNNTPQITLTQSGQLGIGTSSPNMDAILDISSSTQGVLLPRLTNPTTMTSAPDGLVAYNTTDDFLYLRKNGIWRKLADDTNNAPFTLPYYQNVNSTNTLFAIHNSGSGVAIGGQVDGSGYGLYGIANNGTAVYGLTTGGTAGRFAASAGIAGHFTTTGNVNLITSGGSVGINTTSPASEYRLDVNGRMRLRHELNSAGLWFNKSNNTPEAFVGMVNDTTLGVWGSVGGAAWRNAFNLRTGNFGINVSNPLKPLSFDDNIGNKISLWGSSFAQHYGLGIAASTMRMYVPSNTERFEFGFGNAASFTEVARLEADGQFMIGTNTSSYQTHFKKNNSRALILENSNSHSINTENILAFKTGSYYDAMIKTIATQTNESRLGFFTWATSDDNILKERMSISDDGDVFIGTTDEAKGVGYKLRVKGKIIAEELKVQLQASWPDYVFADDYNKMSLYDLETFIDENKHLPNIPPAKEIEKSGLEVGEMQRKMMEKIEELTLYIIELNKKIEGQDKVINELISKK